MTIPGSKCQMYRSLALVTVLTMGWAFPVIPQRRSRIWSGPRNNSQRSCLVLEGSTVTEDSCHDIEKDRGTFIIPVFPLRKAVKMPSETLTLNLYEERYLALAEHVLKDSNRLFGALYCSHKPQIIKTGQGPIVPMVEPGDIGVICNVVHDEEGMVPISMKDDGLRRRIKLCGLAVGRFRIERVLHNGYGGGMACEQDENEFPKPFILVEASCLDDVRPIPGSVDEAKIIDLEQKIYTSMLEQEGILNDMGGGLLSGRAGEDDDEGDESSLALRVFAPLLPHHLKVSIQGDTGHAQSKDVVAMERALHSWVCGSSNSEKKECSIEEQRRELFSFAVASTLVPDKSAADMLRILRCDSTLERLQYVVDATKHTRMLLSGRKFLRDLF